MIRHHHHRRQSTVQRLFQLDIAQAAIEADKATGAAHHSIQIRQFRLGRLRHREFADLARNLNHSPRLIENHARLTTRPIRFATAMRRLAGDIIGNADDSRQGIIDLMRHRRRQRSDRRHFFLMKLLLTPQLQLRFMLLQFPLHYIHRFHQCAHLIAACNRQRRAAIAAYDIDGARAHHFDVARQKTEKHHPQTAEYHHTQQHQK